MVVPTPDPSLHRPNPTTEEEEEEEDALKTNTDCVYFLASPLTCKKGSDCEYRHSEHARVNPRDCWYWLNGNCMNPKCVFRHPPLDGLLGSQAAGPMGVPIPLAQQSSLPPTPRASNDPGKQAVPCIFFQKGYCMKGDRCAFLHGITPCGIKTFQSQGTGPSAVNSFPNKALPPSQGAGPSAASSFAIKTIGTLQKCSQETSKGTLNFSKPTSTPVATKPPVPKVETVCSGSVFNLEKDATPPRATDDGFSTYRPPTTALANGSLLSRTSRVQQGNIANDYDTYKEKEANEFLKESSPGFDVLVEDELEEPDYYHDDDLFARSVGHEGRHISSMEEYDLDPTEEYGAMSELDRHERNQREYGWAQHGDSSVRRDGQVSSKCKSPDRVGESDLRYHLSKQRRVDGLRSVVSNDFVSQSHVEDHGNRVPVYSREGSASSRLKGRIKFPGRSGAANEGNMHRERELDPRGRHLSGRIYQGGRFRERLRGRVMDGYNGGLRDFSGGCRVRSESVDDNGMDFAGPKSLAELKGAVAPRKALQSSIAIGVEASFEGPKPLSVLLKRKRETEDVVDKLTDSSLTKAGTSPDGHEQPESGAVNAPLERPEDVGNDDGAIMEDGYEDPEIYGDDQEGGEYYEEQGEEGDYNYAESDNVDIIAEGEEYLDDDDGGGDFAKKVGVMLS